MSFRLIVGDPERCPPGIVPSNYLPASLWCYRVLLDDGSVVFDSSGAATAEAAFFRLRRYLTFVDDHMRRPVKAMDVAFLGQRGRWLRRRAVSGRIERGGNPIPFSLE